MCMKTLENIVICGSHYEDIRKHEHSSKTTHCITPKNQFNRGCNNFRFCKTKSVPLMLLCVTQYVMFFLLFFFIQFNVPFKIISVIETSQSIGGLKREYPGKTT